MMSFAPVAAVPGAIGAIVPLEAGQLGVLFDARQHAAAIYMSDRVSMSTTHSAVTIDEARAVIGLLSDLIDVMQSPASHVPRSDPPKLCGDFCHKPR